MKPPTDKATWVLGLLGILMASHLSFLGFGAVHCRELNLRALEDGQTSHLWNGDEPKPRTVGEGCANYAATFQGAAETYIAILLALMAPLPRK